MKKSKVALIVVAVVLVVATAIGGTLAWFSDIDTAENNLKMGKFDIVMTEPSYVESNYQAMVPGDKIMKDPTIALGADSVDAKIRIPASSVVITITKADGTTTTATLAEMGAQVADGWTLTDGYYYYANTVTQGVSVPFLKNQAAAGEAAYTMKVPTSWGNDYIDADIEITFKVEAVQADNFEDAAWQAVTSTPIE